MHLPVHQTSLARGNNLCWTLPCGSWSRCAGADRDWNNSQCHSQPLTSPSPRDPGLPAVRGLPDLSTRGLLACVDLVDKVFAISPRGLAGMLEIKSSCCHVVDRSAVHMELLIVD